MTLQLSPDLSARIQAQIATGHFTSEANADVAAGRVGPFDIEQTMAAIQTRLAG